MAYFANGSEGMCFDEECMGCKYGDDPCPIALWQMDFNYKQCNNKVAEAIMDFLVKKDGTCTMKEFMKKHQGNHPDQLKMI